ALHLKVGGDVAAGCADTGVTKIVTDYRDVRSGLQERRRTAMAEHVRGDFLVSKGRALLRHFERVLPQNVGGAVPGQGLAMAIDKDMVRVIALRHAAQPMQGLGSLTPQG